MIKIRDQKIIDVSDWDDLVKAEYGKPYSFQQQDGCKGRGLFHLTIPDAAEDFANDTLPVQINGDEMGVSFEAWKSGSGYPQLFWERNFYPDIQMIANDLHAKGLIKAGKYAIDIDW